MRALRQTFFATLPCSSSTMYHFKFVILCSARANTCASAVAPNSSGQRCNHAWKCSTAHRSRTETESTLQRQSEGNEGRGATRSGVAREGKGHLGGVGMILTLTGKVTLERLGPFSPGAGGDTIWKATSPLATSSTAAASGSTLM